MALDSTKVKDTQFYSGWNIERVQKRVEKTISIPASWTVIETLDAYNSPPLKFYGMYSIGGGQWRMSGSYGGTQIRFRTNGSQIQAMSTNGTQTAKVRYYIMYNKLDTVQ